MGGSIAPNTTASPKTPSYNYSNPPQGVSRAAGSGGQGNYDLQMNGNSTANSKDYPNAYRYNLSGNNGFQNLTAKNADEVNIGSQNSAVNINASGTPLNSHAPLDLNVNGSGNLINAQLDAKRGEKYRNDPTWQGPDTLTNINGSGTRGTIQGGAGDDQMNINKLGGQNLNLNGGEGNDTLRLPGKNSDWNHELKDGNNIYTQGDNTITANGFENVEFQTPEPSGASGGAPKPNTSPPPSSNPFPGSGSGLGGNTSA